MADKDARRQEQTDVENLVMRSRSVAGHDSASFSGPCSIVQSSEKDAFSPAISPLFRVTFWPAHAGEQ